MFAINQQAKKFKQINTELMMTAQKVPIDIMLHTVYQTVETKLENLKGQIPSGTELENILKEVEQGQANLEELLSQLNAINKDLLMTLHIPMPEQPQGGLRLGGN